MHTERVARVSLGERARRVAQWPLVGRAEVAEQATGRASARLAFGTGRTDYKDDKERLPKQLKGRGFGSLTDRP